MDWNARCPFWEYNNIPGYMGIIAPRTAIILKWIWTISIDDMVNFTLDTRKSHGQYFSGLTPAGFDFYAGHYRGEPFACLSDYEAGIRGNPKVGHPAATIPLEMEAFKFTIKEVVSRLDTAWAANEKLLSKAEKIRRLAELVSALFASFLEMHPYGNGNGHMGRLIVTAVFYRYGIILKRWPISHRPTDPPYSAAIRDYQNGNTDGLINFIIDCI
jgi:hypothetical protein